MRLHKDLEKKFPGCYIQVRAGETEVREVVAQRMKDATVREIVSFSRQEISVGSYWMRYYHLRFISVEGYWV
jgi:hypothetical protein